MFAPSVRFTVVVAPPPDPVSVRGTLLPLLAAAVKAYSASLFVVYEGTSHVLSLDKNLVAVNAANCYLTVFID